ncbi:MAG TPA: tetratricopeptide repeat protein [Methylophilus sp.]|uniref:tetratricopeptide repeat protein n=1 Tax=Methylophilus sp. TaxID=29541 RepID=UPI002C538E6F|nr:tetratricopeptide repeat protein [Methylophilus sp.]HSH86563.1 tetratricopeptide repeat protein [Methylophilus sp.]
MNKPLLIAIATRWGSLFGGINSFNTDFLKALAISYNGKIDVVCLVDEIHSGQLEEAENVNVKLLRFPSFLTPPLSEQINFELTTWSAKESIDFNNRPVVWLGHDRITGQKALNGALLTKSKSALIHHMSYVDYEPFAESFASANHKASEQRNLFIQADYLFAIGPLLRDALDHILSDENRKCQMLIPGLADIQPLDDPPKKFIAFLSGRLNLEASKIKQGYLGVAGFASAQRDAMLVSYPKTLCKEPRLILRGVDFELDALNSDSEPFQVEQELKRFAQKYADRVVNIEALPFTHNRQEIYRQLKSASVALMPSWHEGFGLVGWEAISCGVPLILTKKSGLFQWLDEEHVGLAGLVCSIDIRGQVDAPFFHEEDLKSVTQLISEIADSPDKYKKQAAKLRAELNSYTWTNCAQKFINAINLQTTLNVLEDSIENRSFELVSINKYQNNFSKDQFLTIPEKQWKKNFHTDSQLLKAEEAIVPFDEGRLLELISLKNWMDEDSNSLTVRILTGAGGSGKTRLALELCYSYQELGWVTGFLNSNVGINHVPSIIQSIQSSATPILIIIDYAETRQPLFTSILKSILKANKLIQTFPIRILLLAREAGEWWDRLLSADAICEAFLNSKATTGPQSLGNIHLEHLERERAYLNAQLAFANKLGLQPPKTIPPLNGDHLGRPLYLHMAALMALYGERPENASTLTDSLLNHESRYWQALLKQNAYLRILQSYVPERLVALTTLTGGFQNEKEAFTYWKKVSVTDANSIEPITFSVLYNCLNSLHLGQSGMQPLRPDLLGEAQVVRYLLKADVKTFLNALLDSSAPKKYQRHCLTVFARLSHHRSAIHDALVLAIACNFKHIIYDVLEVAIETQGYLGELLVEAFKRIEEPLKGQIAGILDSLLQNQSLQLAKLDYVVCKYLVEKKLIKFRASKMGISDKENLGDLYVNLSLAENLIGLSESALESSSESVKIFTELSNSHPNRFEASYARSFHNHANRLSSFGLIKDTIEFSKIALNVYKRLSIRDKKQYELKYVNCLVNHSNWVALVGSPQEAHTYCQQALKIYKNLAESNERYLENYANGLVNMASRLENLGKYSEALEYCRQAVDIRKKLAEINQDRFEPFYATTLVNYSFFVGLSGDYKDALIPITEALNLFKKFASKLPEKYSYLVVICSFRIDTLNWLDEVNSAINSELITPPSSLLDIELKEFYFTKYSVLALKSNHSLEKEKIFLEMIHIWKELSDAIKNRQMMYALIAYIWIETYGSVKTNSSEWYLYWEKFITNRGRKIPKLMEEIGKRLRIKWPTIASIKET